MFGVLVVEDTDIIAQQLATCVSKNRWLRLDGVAATEQDAIDMARRVRPDLVLLDFGLSSPMGGFDVWRVLHELETHVIAVTAANDMSTVAKAKKRGAFAYVVKPFVSATVQAKLADYINYRRAEIAAPPCIDQPAADIAINPPSRKCPLRSGLLAETWDSVVAVLRAAERPLRASEIAERAHVERATANRYLTELCTQGIAKRVPEHGRPGHPAYLYTLIPLWHPRPDPDKS